jgi:hypothetical protein
MGAMFEFYGALSEPARVGIAVVGILLAIIILILVVAYRVQVWRGIGFLVVALARGIGFLVVALAALAVLAVVISYLLSTLRCRRRTKEAAEKARAGLLKAIEEGKVEPVSDPGELLLRSSETLWFKCPASLSDKKRRVFVGNVCVTSMRVVFTCVEYPLEIPLGEINAVECRQGGLYVVGKKPSRTQVFGVNDAELAAAHITRSVRAYHRQVDVGFERDAGRHIPQDVRTAVWRRDGGKCVQCGATDYLEFDHIIPHAKGGANTVENVQLLCRRCNLKKSDGI